MSAPIGQLLLINSEPCDLEALASEISDALNALVTWNIPAFEAAVERQRIISDGLDVTSGWRDIPRTKETAERIRQLNQVYSRLLQHSIHWTRTLNSILQVSGNAFPSRASVHFRG